MKLLITTFFSISLLFVIGSFKPMANEISIIIHKDNPISQMTAGEVKLYWLRKIKKRWPEINKNIKPADRKSKCAEQEVFYSKVLNMNATDVDVYFNQKQYESGDKPQDKLANDDAIINFVSEEPGAIGYVSSSSLSASDKAKVKVVFVIQ